MLIFGILLILAAGALGFGPLFVDWNKYKAEFEDRASLLLGRQVQIGGPLSIRLFPWPQLTAGDVRIANPAGSMLPDLARIELIDAEMSVAPLLSGRIALQKVRLVRPVFSAERMAAGGFNWTLHTARNLSGLPGAEQIAVAGIDIIDGSLFFGDGRRGGLSELSGIEGRLKAPALDGPWRADITGTHSGAPIELTVSTGKYQDGEPLRMSVAVTPSGSNGFMWAFDGEALRPDGKVAGKINVRPARQNSGKANPLNTQWQIAMSGDLSADFDKVKMDNIEVIPSNDLSGGNLMTGSAVWTLGEKFIVDTRLQAAQLDLDKILGKPLVKEFTSHTHLVAISELLASLPDDTQIGFTTEITSLLTGGATLSQVKLAGQMTPQLLRLSEATANLPGQTRAGFSGVILPTGAKRLPQLAGNIDIDSGSLRDLVTWLVSSKAKDINRIWTGARGRAKLRGQIGWTPELFRLSDASATLDDAKISGSLLNRHDDTPVLNLRLIADTINVDRYAPRGFSTSVVESGTLAGFAELAAAAIAYGDTQVTVQTDTLVMRGVEARDIAINVDVSEGAVELHTVEIGGIGDARLDIAGVLNFPDDGVAGSVSGEFKAQDPRPFLRLLGLIDPDQAQQPWASLLGPVNLKVLGEVSTSKRGNTAVASASGTAAGAAIIVNSDFDGQLAQWRDGKLQLTGSITGASSEKLLALAGIAPVSGGSEPATLKLAFSGTPSAALTGSFGLDMLGSRLVYDGGFTIDPASRISAAGTTSLKTANTGKLLSALGVRSTDLPQQVSQQLEASAQTVLSEGQLQLSNLVAAFPANTASGDISLSGSLRSPRVSGKLAVKHLSGAWLAAALTAPSSRSEATPDTSFDTTRLGWVSDKLEVQAEQMEFVPGLHLSSATLVMHRQKPDVLDITLKGQTQHDQRAPFSMSLLVDHKNSVIKAGGKLATSVDLARVLQTNAGQPALEGPASLSLEFTSTGRSPGGLLSQLSGSGTLQASLVQAGAFNVAQLELQADELSSVEDIETRVTTALQSSPLELATQKADITIDNGIVRTNRIPVISAAGSGNLNVTLDLASSRARLDISIKPDNGLPAVSMRLAGHPLALTRTYNTSALKSHLSSALLQRGLEKLEELQREEQRLVEEERKFREEQERREAERQRLIIEQRQARETARRHAAEEKQRMKAAASARARAARQEQQRLKDLIQENVPSTIPDDAIVKPQNSGIRFIVPQ